MNIALIGCGTIANGRHISAFLELNEITVRYCVDIIRERAESAALRCGAEALEDYRQILDRKDIDAAVICTPNDCHDKIAIDFLRTGKHVLCEKPAAVNLQKVEKMREAAHESGKILNIGVCNRFRKTVIKVKELIENGELGTVYHIYCSFRKHRSIPGLGGAFTTKSIAGGGVLIDWGVHLFDLMLYCTAMPKIQTISANTYCVLGKDIENYDYISMWAGPPKKDGIYDVEDMVSGFIRTDGPSISFNGAWAQNIDEENMYIEFMGDKGGIHLDYYGNFVLYQNRNGVFYRQEAKYNDNDMFYSEIKDFAESVATGRKSVNHIDNIMELAKVLDGIYRSAEQKREIVL